MVTYHKKGIVTHSPVRSGRCRYTESCSQRQVSLHRVLFAAADVDTPSRIVGMEDQLGTSRRFETDDASQRRGWLDAMMTIYC